MDSIETQPNPNKKQPVSAISKSKHKTLNGDPIVCRCNYIHKSTIDEALVGGCKTLNEIFDKTTAGVGPCGGSCRKDLMPMLEHYLETKTLKDFHRKK